MVFDTNRYGFAALGSNLLVMRPEDRPMNTKEWLSEKCGMDWTDVRGYITRDRIQFFDGDYEVNQDVTTEMMDAAFNTYMRLYGATYAEAAAVPVYNGVRRGKEGDQWPPILQYDRTIGEWVIV